MEGGRGRYGEGGGREGGGRGEGGGREGGGRGEGGGREGEAIRSHCKYLSHLPDDCYTSCQVMHLLKPFYFSL